MAIDEAELITALMTNATITASASAAGVSRKTVYNYLDKPSFREKLEKARREREARLSDVMDGATVRAIDALVKIVDAPDTWWSGVTPKDRIEAAKALLGASQAHGKA